jgi:hypothetical protein
MNFLAPLAVGAGGSLLEKLFGNSGKTKMGSISTQTPEQQQLLKNLIGSLGQAPQNISQNQTYQQGNTLLSQLLSGGPNEGLERPLMRQFSESTIPQIGEQFSGSSGSSALNQALAKAAENLLGDIGTMRSQNQISALGQVLPFAKAPSDDYRAGAQLALGQNAFQTTQQPGQQGFLGSVLGGIAPAYGQHLGKGFAGENDMFGSLFGYKKPQDGSRISSYTTGPAVAQPFNW